jgi:hypothetical protein
MIRIFAWLANIALRDRIFLILAAVTIVLWLLSMVLNPSDPSGHGDWCAQDVPTVSTCY